MYVGAGVAVKFSIVSATSIVALLAAGVGPSRAAVLTALPGQTNIYDLVQDGVTSSEGGDSTVSKQDPLVSAVAALEAATDRWQASSFTGPVEPAAAVGNTLPKIPLNAATMTRSDGDFATAAPGAWQWNASQKAHAVGIAMIAPLIGAVGTSSRTDNKPGNTVFVMAASTPGFHDSNPAANGDNTSSAAVAFAPASSSTATITVAGAGNFRQRGGSGFSVVSTDSLQAMPVSTEHVPPNLALTDTTPRTVVYNYAPTANRPAKPTEASFSNVVTATGVFADLNSPAGPSKIQTSELLTQQGKSVQTSQKILASAAQPGRQQPGPTQVSDAANVDRLLDLTQPFAGTAADSQVDGTRTFLSASVSAHPSATAVLYMANIVSSTPAKVAGQTIEAFQVGPAPGPQAQGRSITTISDPLHGKIMASAGALNNSLALP